MKVTINEREYELKELTKEELLEVIKLLIIALNASTWDDGHPGYSDSDPGYMCPDCSCKECYRVSCQYNESNLFKKLYEKHHELWVEE